MPPSESACPGCGAVLPVVGGATNPYRGASPACWARAGDVLAREFGEYDYPPVHRLTVDAYMAQHPGGEVPGAVRSVAIHLMALHLVFERGYSLNATDQAMRVLARRDQPLVHLPRPESLGPLTVLEVVGAPSVEQHTERVWLWARSVWSAWHPQHATIRAWCQALPLP